jgi:hypothetical protein
MSEPLAQALRISGASLIMLTSIESRTTVWSAGRTRVGADVAALGAAITEAAAEMVRLTSAGIEMDDLLVTSPANFHVLRVVDGQVAHLVLDRGSANLAMARREFRQMVAQRTAAVAALPTPEPGEAAVEPPTDTPAGAVDAPVSRSATAVDDEPGEDRSVEAAPARAVVPVQAVPVSEALEGEVLPPSPMEPLRTDAELPRLPQRRADAGWQDDPTAYQATVPTLPEWLRTAAQGPFVNDSQTLDRVVGGLRRLS